MSFPYERFERLKADILSSLPEDVHMDVQSQLFDRITDPKTRVEKAAKKYYDLKAKEDTTTALQLIQKALTGTKIVKPPKGAE